jgi:hypothetical protein
MKNNLIVLLLSVQAFTFLYQDAVAQQKFDKKKHSEDPQARVEWEIERLRDPKTNVIPENAALKEREFISKIPSRESLRYDKKQASLQSLTWEHLGPNTIGGRTRALVFDIANTNNMLAGAASGGVWRTIDGGESWTKTTAPEYNQTVSTIVQDRRPGKTNTWYYGTGELLSTTDRRVTTLTRTISVGQGIFKSTDNGSTWTQLASTKIAQPNALDNFNGVWKLAIDSSNSEQEELYAACYGGILRSVNGGESWTPVLVDSGKKAFCSDIVITKTGVCYAIIGSALDLSPSQKQGVWRSEDGITWTQISPTDYLINARRVVIAPAPSNENILYFMAEAPNGPDWTVSHNKLWRYTHNADSSSGPWEALHNKVPSNVLSSLGGYCLALAVKPDNPQVVFIGGTNLYRSKDALATPISQANIVGGYNTQLHPDIQALTFHPTNPNRLYVASDGGVTHTPDCNDSIITWININNGYSTTQFYNIAMNHFDADDDWLIGGLQDNGTVLYSSRFSTKDHWMTWTGGDGMHAAIGPKRTPVISSFQGGNLINGDYIIRPEQLNNGNFLFYTAFTWDKANFDHLYLPAKNQLWRLNEPERLDTLDWAEIPAVRLALSSGEIITSVAASKIPAHRVYVGTNKGRVLRVDNATTTPQVTNITDAAFPVNGFVGCVDVNENNADRIVAVFSNYNVPSIFSSENGGATWTHVGGNLDEGSEAGIIAPSVRWVKSLNLGSKTMIFAATTSGLFSTETLNGTQTNWLREGATSIGAVQIETIDAKQSTGEVVVATHGNGVYRSKLATSIAGDAENTYGASMDQNYPNPATSSTIIKYTVPVEGHVKIKLYSSNGTELLTLADKVQTAGEHFIELNNVNYPAFKSLSSGKYFYRIEYNDYRLTRSLEIVR